MDGVEKLLDRIGIYDLMAVLLPGSCILLIMILLQDWMPFYMPDFCAVNVNMGVVFLLLSYIIGLVFQEVGSIIFNVVFRPNGVNIIIKYVFEGTAFTSEDEPANAGGEELDSQDANFEEISTELKCAGENPKQKNKKTNKNAQVLRCILSICNPQRVGLTKMERDTIRNRINNSDENDYDYDACFNQCKWEMIKENKTARIDKEQSLSSMSRNLSLGFFLIAIMLMLRYRQTENAEIMYSSVVLLFLSVLFFVRTLRFQMLRYFYVFRWYYHTILGR